MRWSHLLEKAIKIRVNPGDVLGSIMVKFIQSRNGDHVGKAISNGVAILLRAGEHLPGMSIFEALHPDYVFSRVAIPVDRRIANR
jgi:hypothetical protein